MMGRHKQTQAMLEQSMGGKRNKIRETFVIYINRMMCKNKIETKLKCTYYQESGVPSQGRIQNSTVTVKNKVS